MGKSFTSANFGSIAANTPTVVTRSLLAQRREGFGASWSQAVPQSSGAHLVTQNYYLITQTSLAQMINYLTVGDKSLERGLGSESDTNGLPGTAWGLMDGPSGLRQLSARHRQLGRRPGDLDDRRIVRVEGRGDWAGGHRPSYKGLRFPVEVISHCVWLYHRFPLSVREVEEMMLRGASRSPTTPSASGPGSSARPTPQPHTRMISSVRQSEQVDNVTACVWQGRPKQEAGQ